MSVETNNHSDEKVWARRGIMSVAATLAVILPLAIATTTIFGCNADYSCCFTKFPFGSTSNRDSLPLALTNTS